MNVQEIAPIGMAYFGRLGILSGFVVLLTGTIQCQIVVRPATQAPSHPRYGQPYRRDL